MKSLRQLLASAPRRRETAAEAEAPTPVPFLAAVARPELRPDLGTAFDRTLFGLPADVVRSLDPAVLHALELSWEALERSGADLPQLPNLRVDTWSDGRVGAGTLTDLLGLSGLVRVNPGTDGALISLAEARAALLAGDIDLALVVGRIGQGVAAIVLGPPDHARWGHVGWLLGSAAARRHHDGSLAQIGATALATAQAGDAPTMDEPGLHGVFTALARPEGASLVEGASGDRVAAVVIRPARPEPAEGAGPRLLALSARSKGSLRELVGQVLAQLHTDDDLRSMATDASRRALFERRLALPVSSAELVRKRLERWLEGDRDAVASSRGTDRGIAFVFPTAGAQYANMAGTLYDAEPAFRAAVMRCDRILRRRLPRPLLSLMFPQAGREVPLDDPLFANPLTFVLGYALHELLAAWGVRPACVVGCGVGELAAATTAGAISLEDGLMLAVERGRLLRTVSDAGARAVLTGSEEQVRELLEASQLPGVDVVAVPMPDRAVIGGPLASMDILCERLVAQGMRVERLAGHPAHTSLVDHLLEEFREAAATVRAQAPTQAKWVSTATGHAITTAVGADHWVATLRGPMRFAVAAEDAYFAGSRTFIELAARPVMVGAGRRTLSHLPVAWASALLGAEHDDHETLVEALAILWTRGHGHLNEQAVRGAGALLPPTPLERRPIDAMDELVHPPLFEGRGETLVPDEPLPDDLQAMVDEAMGADDDGVTLPPDIAPPIITDDKTIDEEGRLSDRDQDIATFFGEEGQRPATLTEADEEPSPTEALVDTASFVGAEKQPMLEVWEPVPLAEPDVEDATWIVLADSEGFGDYLLALLTAAGHEGIRVVEAQPYPRGDGTIFVPDPSADGAWEPVLDRLGTLNGPVRVLHLWALDSEAHTEPWLALIRLLHTFRFRGLNVPTFLVTRGLFGAEPSVPAALLWGAGRQLQVESPEQWGGAIDLDEDEDAEALLAHLLERAAPAEVAFRDGVRLARRLRPEGGDGEEPTLDMAGTWVLVGHIDGTTLTLLHRLVSKGASRFVLLSSDPPGAKAMMEVLALKKKGIEATMLRADLRSDVERARVRQRLAAQGDIAGVIVRLALSEGPVLGSDDAVGRDEVAALEALPDLLQLGPSRIIWMPGEALDPVDASGWTAVIGPAVVQLAGGLGASVVSGPFDGDDAVDQFLAGLRPGQVVALPT